MIDISTKKIVFDIKTKLLNPKLEKVYRKNASQQFSSDLKALNLTKRKSLIDYAFNHTTFYKNHYNAVDFSSEVIDDEFFFKLPIVTRKHIQNQFSDFVSDSAKPKDYYNAATGGSTGTPISVLHDKRYPLTGIQWRVLKWWGVESYENAAFIYRIRRSGFKKIINDLLWWPTKRIFLDASRMDKNSMHQFVKKINKTKPSLLQGYTGGVYEFALFLKDNHLKIQAPKAVWVTSAPLPESQRQVMQEVFGAPVYDQYGTCEIMWLSAECKQQNGMHMMSDIRYIEFVDENNNPVPEGEWGRILLTDLQNYAFPLIRYEIGDYGRSLPNKCKCGIELPLMDNVKGRQSDIIKTPSGTIISGEYLTTIFDDFPDAVRGFQVVQHKDYSIELYYVPGDKPETNRIVDQVLEDLKNKIDHSVKVSAKKLNKIRHDRGKTKFVISHLE